MLTPLYKSIGYLLAVAYTVVPAHNLGLAIILAHLRGDAGAVPADRQAGAVDDRDAEGSTRDQAFAGEVQGRQAEAERGDSQVLPGEQDQSAGGLSAARHAVPDLHLPVPRAASRSSRTSRPPAGSTCSSSTSAAPASPRQRARSHRPGLRFLGMDLSKSLWEVRGESIITLIPYVISILLVIATGWYQARQTMARQQNNTNATPVNSQMQFMTKVFPIVFGVLLVAVRLGSRRLLGDEQHVAHRPAAPGAEQDLRERATTPRDGRKSSAATTTTSRSKPEPTAQPRRRRAPRRVEAKCDRRRKAGPGANEAAGAQAGSRRSRPRDRAKRTGNGTGNGAAAPASAGNRRKKRKR